MKKTPLLLVILILLPIVFLSWYSIRLENQQQALFGHQLAGLIETQLAEVREGLQDHFLRVEQALQEESRALFGFKDQAYSDQKLRALVKSSPYIDQIFVLNQNREPIYPILIGSSIQESRFLQEYQTLLQRSDLFTSREESDLKDLSQVVSRNASSPVEPVSAKLKSALSAPKLEISSRQQVQADAGYRDSFEASSEEVVADDISGAKASGWVAWYQGAELQHIYWMEDPDGEVIGFKLNDARLLSDLLNQLPDQTRSESHETLTNSAIRIVNSVGDVFYEWGDLPEISDQLQPLKTLPLYHPMGSWHLEFYSPSLQAPKSQWFDKVLILMAVLLVLSATAWLLYREQTRAVRLAEQRVNFVNQVSHELKTPLTNVRMYSEMLSDRIDESSEAEQRYLGVINSESQRLSRLIDNVLSFSKLGRKSHELSLQKGQLCEVIDRVVESFRPAFAQKGLEISVQDDCQAEVLFDPAVIEQILNNLLGNCEKYAAGSGVVKISCGEDKGDSLVLIRVADSGPGIPVNQQERIFEPFYRISNKLSDGVSGTGIGLNIARDLARAHGGDLMLENGDQGAAFLLTLPLMGEQI